MSHQRPLSEQVDFYDDSQNLLDLVTDDQLDDQLWCQAQLKAALQESLADTGSAQTACAPPGQPIQAVDDEFVTQLQLEEVLWASQLEGVASQQQQQQQLKPALQEPLADTGSAEAACAPQRRPIQAVEDEFVTQLQLEEVLWASQLEVVASQQQQQQQQSESVMVSVDSGLCADMDDESDMSSDEEKSEELREVLEMQREMRTTTVEEHVQRAGTRLRRQKLQRKEGNLQSIQDGGIESTTTEPCLVPSPFNDNGIPETWDCDVSRAEFSTSDYTLVPLLPGNTEYDAIHQEFSKASLTVVSIERLQNFILLDRYRREKEHILDNRQNGFDLNEQYLYHGTKVEKRVVCEESLDQRLGRKGHFGRGIYFSDSPRKCLQYASRSEDAICILKCRVILGDTKMYPRGQSDTTLKREPPKEAPSGGWKFYDSVKGCPKDFNEFVIYDSRRAMTEYIIMCKKSIDGQVTNQNTVNVPKEATAVQAVPTTDSNTEHIGTGNKLKWVRVPVTSVNGDENSNAVTTATSSVAVLTTTTTDSGAASEGVVSVTSDPRVQNDDQSHRDDRSIADEDSDGESVNSEMSDCDSVTGDRNAGDGNDLSAVADGVSDTAFPGPPSIVPFNPDQVAVRDDEHEERIRKVREEIRRQRQLEKSQQAANPSGKKVSFIVDKSALSRQPFSYLTEDPVELVLSQLIKEFLEVTQTTDSSVARDHITQAKMNLNQAVFDYYKNLS